MRLTRAFLGYLKKYIENEIAETTSVSVWKPIRGWRTTGQKWHYTEDRPWTDAAKAANMPGKKKEIWLEPIKQWKVFKGDRVEILIGKDKGKQGIVNGIIRERNWCFVEGLNCKYKTMHKSSTNPGILIKEEKPLLVTEEVSLVDPSDEKPTQVEWRYTEEGKQVRVSLRTGRLLPLPHIATDEEDFVLKSSYIEQDKDTKEKELTDITFQPKLATFEEDILQQMGIQENRKPAKTYYY